MEFNQPTPAIPQNDTRDTTRRHLPSYEEVNVPYSLRLPNYRSSYIRRFHPYPRYFTPPPECHFTDDGGEDVLDLSILDERVRQPVIEREPPDSDAENNNNEQENAVEGGVNEVAAVDAEPVAVHGNEGEQVDEGQSLLFKLDITKTLEVLHIN